MYTCTFEHAHIENSAFWDKIGEFSLRTNAHTRQISSNRFLMSSKYQHLAFSVAPERVFAISLLFHKHSSHEFQVPFIFSACIFFFKIKFTNKRTPVNHISTTVKSIKFYLVIFYHKLLLKFCAAKCFFFLSLGHFYFVQKKCLLVHCVESAFFPQSTFSG